MENTEAKDKEEAGEAISIDNKNGIARISLNPLVYNMNVIYTTSYLFLEKSYVLLDGDPKKEIIVELRPKELGPNERIALENNENSSIKQLCYEFMDSLIITGFSRMQNKESADVKSLILKRILLIEGLEQEKSNKEKPKETRKEKEKTR